MVTPGVLLGGLLRAALGRLRGLKDFDKDPELADDVFLLSYRCVPPPDSNALAYKGNASAYLDPAKITWHAACSTLGRENTASTHSPSLPPAPTHPTQDPQLLPGDSHHP